jgi:hypothetical protein
LLFVFLLTPLCPQSSIVVLGDQHAVQAEGLDWEARFQPLNLGRLGDAQCTYCGAWMFRSERLKQSSTDFPEFGDFCCKKGAVSLLPYPPLPAVVMDIVMRPNLREHTRYINTTFAMAGVWTTLDHRYATRAGSGVYHFCIQGALYNNLPPNVAHTPGVEGARFSQLYLYDGATATAERLVGADEGQRALLGPYMLECHDWLLHNNPIVRALRSLYELDRGSAQPTASLRILPSRPHGKDQRIYNQPADEKEVAMLIHGHDERIGPHDLIVRAFAPPGQAPQRHMIIHPANAAGQALRFPLAYPHGSHGWCPGIPLLHHVLDGDIEDPDYALAAGPNGTRPAAPLLGGQGVRASRAAANKCVTLAQYVRYELHVRTSNRSVPPTVWDPNAHPGIYAFANLGQEIMVTQWCNIESERLRWMYFNQDKLRADLYPNVAQHLAAGVQGAAQLGQRVILPSSYHNGPRNRTQKYYDVASITAQRGRPTIFLTMTANPMWPEVQASLRPSETAASRPDLVARVFHMRLQSLIELVTGLNHIWLNVMGKCLGYTYVIEFQKRGLPHVHLVLFYERAPNTDDAVDSLISAQLPDPAVFPRLHRLVSTLMMHGPCGADDPTRLCMEDGHCSKHFPKSFGPDTLFNGRNYPVYARPDNGRTVQKHLSGGRTVALDNRWVVPYCPALLAVLECHINVEVCASDKSIKYLFKYMFKGQPRALAVVEPVAAPAVAAAPAAPAAPAAAAAAPAPAAGAAAGAPAAPAAAAAAAAAPAPAAAAPAAPVDEIRQYLDCRHLSNSEALWLAFGFEMSVQQPAVVRLPVHLPNNQSVLFRANATLAQLQAALNKAERTQLTAFFAVCTYREHRGEPPILYENVVADYTWDANERVWKPRAVREVRFPPVARVHNVPPAAGEKFYVRLLLKTVPGPTSFEALRTVGPVLYPTFQAACVARSLLQDAAVWSNTLTEACALQTSGRALRSLFLRIVSHCEVADVAALWAAFQVPLSEDLQRRIARVHPGAAPDDVLHDAINLCLRLLLDELPTCNAPPTVAAALPAPQPCRLILTLAAGPDQVSVAQLLLEYGAPTEAQTPEQLHAFLAEAVPRLNEDQRRIYNTVCAIFELEQGRIIMIDAPGGSGKTFLAKVILAMVRATPNATAIASASTGIASLLLPDANTTHKAYGVPLNPDEHSLCAFGRLDSLLRPAVMGANLHLADEYSMINRHVYEAIDRSLHDCFPNIHAPMAGRLFLLSGDPRQCPPVVEDGGDREDIVPLSVQLSYLADAQRFPFHIQHCHLTINERVRQAPDPHGDAQHWASFLLTLGEGRLEPFERDYVQLPACIMFPNGASPLLLCHFVFGNVAQRLQDLGLTPAYARWVAEGALLAPTNEVARELSSTMSSRLLGGNAVTLRSVDGLQDPYADPDNNYADDVLNLHQPNGFPPHKLELRVGDVVTIVRNLDGVLKNGVRAIVMDVFPNMLRIMVASGKEETIGTVHLLPRIKLIDDCLETGLPVAMFRIQFPVTLAWAMTINKAQGQTMKRVGLYLRTQCFSHGQLYVALSRSPSIHGVRVITCKKIRDVPVVRNVVWPELLPGIAHTPVLNLNNFPPAWKQPPQ